MMKIPSHQRCSVSASRLNRKPQRRTPRSAVLRHRRQQSRRYGTGFQLRRGPYGLEGERSTACCEDSANSSSLPMTCRRQGAGTPSCWAWSRTSNGWGRTAGSRIWSSVGDYQHELGLIDREHAPHGSAGGPAGAVANWHVDDIEAALERLLSMSAKEHEGRTERGEGFVTASVIDPFGNILGITYSPQFLEIRKRAGAFELPDVKQDVPPGSRSS